MKPIGEAGGGAAQTREADKVLNNGKGRRERQEISGGSNLASVPERYERNRLALDLEHTARDGGVGCAVSVYGEVYSSQYSTAVNATVSTVLCLMIDRPSIHK